MLHPDFHSPRPSGSALIVCGGVVVAQTNNQYHSSVHSVELSWIELRVDQFWSSASEVNQSNMWICVDSVFNKNHLTFLTLSALCPSCLWHLIILHKTGRDVYEICTIVTQITVQNKVPIHPPTQKLCLLKVFLDENCHFSLTDVLLIFIERIYSWSDIKCFRKGNKY